MFAGCLLDRLLTSLPEVCWRFAGCLPDVCWRFDQQFAGGLLDSLLESLLDSLLEVCSIDRW